jgi:hypothetical protein
MFWFSFDYTRKRINFIFSKSAVHFLFLLSLAKWNMQMNKKNTAKKIDPKTVIPFFWNV